MISISKKIASNSALLIGAELSSKAIRVFLVVFSARLLGVENYGIFSFAMAFTILFLIVADMGIHQLLVREVARKPEMLKKYLSNALFIKLLLIVLNLTLIFFAINLTNKPKGVIITVIIIAVSQIFNSFGELFKSIFQAFQRMKYDATSTLLHSFFDSFLGLGILFLGGGYQALAWMYLVASLLNLIYCLVITVKKFTPLSLDIDIPLIKFILSEGLPFGIMYFFAMMYTYIDSVMLSLMTNDEVVGWYSAAYRLVFTMLFIPMGMMKAVFPVLSKYYKESMEKFTRLFEKTFKILFFIGFSLACIITLLSDKIILLLYGDKYINASGALQILVWSTALIFITTVMTHATRASDRQRFTAKMVGIGAFFNLALNFILIPKYSYIGAASATLATELLIFIFHLFYLSYKLVKPPFVKLLPKILIINAVVTIYIILFQQLNIFILASSALTVNLIMVFITRYFSNEEYVFIKEILRLSRS